MTGGQGCLREARFAARGSWALGNVELQGYRRLVPDGTTARGAEVHE
jgi:hypothetical protein